MSLKHALLGFLNFSPFTGYDLKKLFDTSMQYFWSATHTQIYRTLNQMHEEGLVRREIVEQTDHPDKKVYTITEEGEQVLRDWLKHHYDLPPIRHRLLVQLSFANLLEDDEIIALLADYGDKLRERLVQYHSDEATALYERARSERERFLWDLTLKNGIATYEAELNWIEQAIEDFKNLQEKEP